MINDHASLRIGSLTLKSPLLLAPMLEPNDIAFRLLCKQSGAALTYTGMVSPQSLQAVHFDDVPALQLFGHTSKGFASFVKEHDSKVSLWDFNLGCPSKLSKKLAHGAFMHSDFDTIRKILTIIRKHSNKPVTIKLRKSPQALELARFLDNLGLIDAVGIHPRTAEQGYSGVPDYDFAIKLRDSISVPVIYSGDVNKDNIASILKDFPFVFVGRAAVGSPGFFSSDSVDNLDLFKQYLVLARKYGLHFRQVKYHAMQFTKGLKYARKMRARLIKAKTLEDIEEIFFSEE